MIARKPSNGLSKRSGGWQKARPDPVPCSLNFHRPGLFPESVTDAQGKTRTRDPLDGVMTPFEKLKSIPAMASFLKPSITLDSLEIESKHFLTTRLPNSSSKRSNHFSCLSTTDPRSPLDRSPLASSRLIPQLELTVINSQEMRFR